MWEKINFTQPLPAWLFNVTRFKSVLNATWQPHPKVECKVHWFNEGIRELLSSDTLDVNIVFPPQPNEVFLWCPRTPLPFDLFSLKLISLFRHFMSEPPKCLQIISLRTTTWEWKRLGYEPRQRWFWRHFLWCRRALWNGRPQKPSRLQSPQHPTKQAISWSPRRSVIQSWRCRWCWRGWQRRI